MSSFLKMLADVLLTGSQLPGIPGSVGPGSVGLGGERPPSSRDCFPQGEVLSDLAGL